MANYAVSDWESGVGELADVLAALEVQLETVDNNKAIRHIEVHHVGGSMFVASLVYDA